MTEDQQRFSEIINNIDDLMEEAINIIPESMVAKAKSYWYAHIMCAVSDDHEFLGGSMHHMQDCLDEWMEQEEVSQEPYLQFNTQEEWDDYVARNGINQHEDPIDDEVEETNFIDGYESPGWVRKLKGYPLPNEGPINDEDWDHEAGRPANMRDEDWD